MMKRVAFYLLAILLIDSALLVASRAAILPDWWMSSELALSTALVGGIGGCVYCLRGIYLNACVRKNWDDTWLPWYFIRPLVSHVCGFISYLFLGAGLLVLEASRSGTSTDLGFLALAFIAGFNVDRFISKLEDLAQATWGIDKSRVSSGVTIDDNQDS